MNQEYKAALVAYSMAAMRDRDDPSSHYYMAACHHALDDVDHALSALEKAIHIAGEPSGMVVVRTYFPSNPPQDAEKKELADKALLFVQGKLEQGRIPWAGVLEAE